MKLPIDRKAVVNWFSGLKRSEKFLVSLAGISLLLYGGYTVGELVSEETSNLVSQVEGRRKQLKDLDRVLNRYAALVERQKLIEKTFAQSELTLDQVYTELDRVVKESIGSGNYDLKQGTQTQTVGKGSEQREFSLRLKSLTLDQLVSLLYQLEHGKVTLFVGKVDILKTPQPGVLSAVVEVSSIQKKKG